MRILLQTSAEKDKPYGSLGNKVGNGDDITRVSINESLVPSVGLVVANLQDVGELEGAVLLGDVLKGGLGELILDVLARQSGLSGLDSILNSDRGSRGFGYWKRSEINYNFRSHINIQLRALTKEFPKATTLLSELKAMLATALATGIPLTIC